MPIDITTDFDSMEIDALYRASDADPMPDNVCLVLTGNGKAVVEFSPIGQRVDGIHTEGRDWKVGFALLPGLEPASAKQLVGELEAWLEAIVAHGPRSYEGLNAIWQIRDHIETRLGDDDISILRARVPSELIEELQEENALAGHVAPAALRDAASRRGLHLVGNDDAVAKALVKAFGFDPDHHVVVHKSQDGPAWIVLHRTVVDRILAPDGGWPSRIQALAGFNTHRPLTRELANRLPHLRHRDGKWQLHPPTERVGDRIAAPRDAPPPKGEW